MQGKLAEEQRRAKSLAMDVTARSQEVGTLQDRVDRARREADEATRALDAASVRLRATEARLQEAEVRERGCATRVVAMQGATHGLCLWGCSRVVMKLV